MKELKMYLSIVLIEWTVMLVFFVVPMYLVGYGVTWGGLLGWEY